MARKPWFIPALVVLVIDAETLDEATTQAEEVFYRFSLRSFPIRQGILEVCGMQLQVCGGTVAPMDSLVEMLEVDLQ